MKTGIELITEERNEQIEKHGRTVELDKAFNTTDQMRSAAKRLIEIKASPDDVPVKWDRALWASLCAKRLKDRIIIAGALLAAELDRLQATES